MNPRPPIAKSFKVILFLAIGIPFLVAVFLIETQTYPATIVIRWYADSNGMFPVRSATFTLAVLFCLPILAFLLVLLLIKKLFFKSPKC